MTRLRYTRRMSLGRLLRFLGFTLVVLVLVAFIVQNSGRAVGLSLDLYVGAWRLARPVPVTWLMAGCFGAGLVLASLVGAVRRRALRERIARLEQDALLQRASAGEWAKAK